MLASFRSIYRPALSCASHPSIVRASSPCLISRSAYKSIVIPRRSFYGHISDPKMAPNLEPYFKQVDAQAEGFIERLRAAVAIPSVSSSDEHRPDVFRMGDFLAEELKKLGAEVELRPLGKEPGRPHLELPPVVIARYGNDKNKRTVLVYGHYDVQPALQEDGWATKPFDLTVDEKGRMFGRGSTDDKGPVLGWINAIEAHQKAGVDFPVNLLCCFEGMEEYGSEGLDDFINPEQNHQRRQNVNLGLDP